MKNIGIYGKIVLTVGEERIGDVSNVVFTNGAIEKDGNIYIYYVSSDTRLHLATTTVEKWLTTAKTLPKTVILHMQALMQSAVWLI